MKRIAKGKRMVAKTPRMLCVSMILAAFLGNAEIVLASKEPVLEWQKTFGGFGDDWGFSVQQTTDGGYIIAGTTNTFGAGDYDAYLIKTEPNGDLQWQKTFGVGDGDEGHSVQQTTDGGYIIAGRTNLVGGGNTYAYLVKTEPNGTLQWQTAFGGGENDYCNASSVQQTTDGGYIIVGNVLLDYGDPDSNSDVYLAKTEPNGTLQWQKTFGGGDDEGGESVQQTNDGGYIIVGGTGSFGVYDVYFIKTDPDGVLEWGKTFGEPGYSEGGSSVRQTTDGGYIIAGSTTAFGAGNYDVYLIKTEPNGALQWQRAFGGSGVDYGFSVQQTTDGGYIIVGSTNSFGFGAYIIKTEPNGVLQWQGTYGIGYSGYSVQQTTDGGYIVVGNFSAGDDDDVYLMKIREQIPGDLDIDWDVDFIDYSGFVPHWMYENCAEPNWCDGADFNESGRVDFYDLDIFIRHWLTF